MIYLYIALPCILTFPIWSLFSKFYPPIAWKWSSANAHSTNTVLITLDIPSQAKVFQWMLQKSRPSLIGRNQLPSKAFGAFWVWPGITVNSFSITVYSQDPWPKCCSKEIFPGRQSPLLPSRSSNRLWHPLQFLLFQISPRHLLSKPTPQGWA